jgi:uncharacterized protein (TIGR02246 family)
MLIRARTIFIHGLCALALAACGTREIASPGVAPELKHSWEVSFNKGDADAVANLYSDQAVLVMSGSKPVEGRDGIHKTVGDMIKSGVKVQIGSAQNVGSGDLAYVYGPYSVLDHEGGREVEKGTYVEIWHRRAGTWQIDLDVNSAGPAGAPPDQPVPGTQPQ